MENSVKYKIYVKNEDSFVTESNLEALQANYLAFLSPIIDDFIWQNEPFYLVIRPSKGDVPAHLYGKTKFGDNVGDEWFIVSLLFELSKAFPETCVSISDNDGEFLLIEAAHFLPRWLNPENSKNRVFVHNGKVHIIPIPSTPGELTIYLTGTPTVLRALQLVFGVQITEAAVQIQRAISQRIDLLTEQSHNTCHHAHCYVPVEVKHVLDQRPSLISPIVRAFYERDPADMKACRTMEQQFTLKTRLMARIRFTRCLFAQLSQQPFKPGRQSEWTLPPVSDPHYKAHELGLKLAYGFQILCKRSGMEEAGVKEEGILRGPKWESFLASLTEQGYFKGEVEGSRLYQELLKKAQKQFSEYFTPENRADPGEIILRILKDAKIDVKRMKEEELLPDDDDSWLELSEHDLEDILSRYSDPNSKLNGTECETEGENKTKNDGASVDLDSVTRSLKSFVDKVSSYEGAELPRDGEDSNIQFDANSFMDAVGNLLGHGAQRLDGSSESGSDDDDEMMSSDEEDEPEQGVQRNTLHSGEHVEMKSYMDQMDEELARTSIGESFEKRTTPFSDLSSQQTQQGQDNLTIEPHEDDEEDTPVDVDFNLVKNILESFSTQQGLAGPASNILNSMGVWLPPNKDLTDST